MGLKKLIFLVFLFTYIHVNAQPTDFQEEVFVSVSSTNMLVGEQLHFSAFVYSNSSKKLSRLSSILYVELIDKSGQAVFQTKIGLRNGRGSGNIYLNPNWLTGTYRLVAYTRWMKNYVSFFEQNILVFNPYNGLSSNESIAGNPIKQVVGEGRIMASFETLQQVSLNLGEIDPASVSVSILKVEDLAYPNAMTMEQPAAKVESFEFLPEYKYGLVQGRLKNVKNSEPVRVNMSINGTSMQVATTLTDRNGKFWMQYNPEHTLSNASVQIKTENATDDQIEMVDEFYTRYRPMDSIETQLDSAILTAVINRSVNSQIQAAYETSRKVISNLQKYTLPSAEVYVLNDYKRFTSIRDTFIELIIYVGVSKSEDNYRMSVRCNSDIIGLRTTNLAPLILLDGLMVSAQEVLTQSPNDIEKIEVVPEYYFVNDTVYKGIVSVHSFKGKKNESSTIGRLTPLAEYQPYNEEGFAMELEERLPLYESELYWNPIYFHQGGEFKVNFSTSRLEGVYQISVKGISKNGLPVDVVKHFHVNASGQ